MLKCREVLVLGSSYVDGALTPAERRALRLHLLICRHCRKYVRCLRLTRATVGMLLVPVEEQRIRQILSVIPSSD